MDGSQLSEPGLLKSILEPLLEDCQYWFSPSRSLLETQNISFLSQAQHSDLLARVKLAEIELATLIPWHRLVAECWEVSRQWRSLGATTAAVEISGDPNLDSLERSHS